MSTTYKKRDLFLLVLLIATSFAQGQTQLHDLAFNDNRSVNAISTTSKSDNNPLPLFLSKVQTSQCGSTLPAVNSIIKANVVYGAQGYRFEVTNGNTVRVFDTDLNAFNLTQLTNVAEYNTTYSIRVATKFNSVYGEYGLTCNVTTPNSEEISLHNNTKTPDVIPDHFARFSRAYPNPLTNTFKLEYTPITQENVTITVSEMTGKQIEFRLLKASEVNNLELGSQYASGMYNIRIVQGNITEDIRVIKE